MLICQNTVYVWGLVLMTVVNSLHSPSPSSSCAGLPPAVRGGALLPADAHDQGAGALEAGARATTDGAALRLPCGSRHARPGREDRLERGEGAHRGDLPRDRRRNVQLSQRRLEPGPNTRHPLSPQWLLQAQLRPGKTPETHFCWLYFDSLLLFCLS